MITLDNILNEVKASGLRYETVMGGKHVKIVVEGEFCGIWPKNGRATNRRGSLNILSQVRRCVKKHKGD